MEVPLWCAVAASNELPESDELDALFDRCPISAFPIRDDRQVFTTVFAGFYNNGEAFPPNMKHNPKRNHMVFCLEFPHTWDRLKGV
jgi:hypothetical protein